MADGGSNMKNDAFYAEMIQMMRAQGSKDNPVSYTHLTLPTKLEV